MEIKPTSMAKVDNINVVSVPDLLPEMVAAEFRRLITQGEWKPGMKIPSEMDLTTSLGVSRGTLRAAIKELVAQGYIVRRRGVGTFVHHKPLISNNLSINSSVTEMIASLGMKPGCSEVETSVEMAGERVIGDLGLKPGSEVVVVKRVRTANGEPVSYSIDNIPPAILSRGRDSLSEERLRALLSEDGASLYNIFRKHLAIRVDHALAEIKPVKVDQLLMKKLKVKPDDVLLRIRQIDYTAKGLPVMVSTEYHESDISTHYVYRKS